MTTKYAIIIPDGAADNPIDEFDGKTPLEAAETPNIDAIAIEGRQGLVHTIPPGMAAGSVKEFADLNGDRYLNPGFLKGITLTNEEAKTIGYRDGTVDLPPHECFSGMFLSGDVFTRAAFE